MHLKQYATNFYYTHTWQQTKIYLPVTRIRSWHGSVNVVTKLLIGWLKNHGLIPGRGKRTISSLKCPDWHWGPPSLLFNGYWKCFPPWGKSADSFHLVPKMYAAMLSIPPYAFTVWTGRTILYHKNPTAIMFMKNTYYPAW
jgi:hypothetical protein